MQNMILPCNGSSGLRASPKNDRRAQIGLQFTLTSVLRSRENPQGFSLLVPIKAPKTCREIKIDKMLPYKSNQRRSTIRSNTRVI